MLNLAHLKGKAGFEGRFALQNQLSLGKCTLSIASG
jgi:hypothetical protein